MVSVWESGETTERVGFEPTVALVRLHALSKRVPSAARAPLLRKSNPLPACRTPVKQRLHRTPQIHRRIPVYLVHHTLR